MGIDTAGGNDNNILAAEAGRVTYAAVRGGYGKTLIVEHSGAWQGYETLYAHLSDYRVQVGQTVTRGQVIGIEGSTGRSSGPHLHFEIKRNGTRIDPEPILSPCFRGVYGQGTRTRLKCN
jgi:murein DD-endopeptidase MepM/ murein hydrolase activator NlpD